MYFEGVVMPCDTAGLTVSHAQFFVPRNSVGISIVAPNRTFSGLHFEGTGGMHIGLGEHHTKDDLPDHLRNDDSFMLY